MHSGELFEVLQCHQRAARNLTSGCVMPGDKQIRDHVDRFCVSQALTVCLGCTQGRHEIASRAVRPSCRQCVDIGL